MVRNGTCVLCMVIVGCAAARRDREPAGTGPSLLPPDLSLQQVFETADDPPGVIVDGWYHSHQQKEEFSSLDKSHGFAIALYLCAPSRQVKKLTPEGTVIVK